MKDQISCFLPCREGSQRVPRKNIKPFAGYENGLVEVKLRQLLSCEAIDEVVLSTDDLDILAYAKSIQSTKLRLHHRVQSLSSSATSTDDLVAHALELIPEGHVLWTHVTSPFLTTKHYSSIVSCYKKALKSKHDSLMTTTPLHTFLWQDGRPMNYDREKEKWPRTQTLKAIHEVNSGVFLAPTSVYRSLGDRIGTTPYMYELDKLTSHDIDWPEDFVLAECIAEKRLASL